MALATCFGLPSENYLQAVKHIVGRLLPTLTEVAAAFEQVALQLAGLSCYSKALVRRCAQVLATGSLTSRMAPLRSMAWAPVLGQLQHWLLLFDPGTESTFVGEQTAEHLQLSR